jgi:hypothetical protein
MGVTRIRHRLQLLQPEYLRMDARAEQGVCSQCKTISSASGNARLNGLGSKDPDGKILRYLWQKVSGPAHGLISGEVTSQPSLTGLNYPGIYTYQLRVVDDRAEWSSDMIKITVVDGNVLN